MLQVEGSWGLRGLWAVQEQTRKLEFEPAGKRGIFDECKARKECKAFWIE